MINLIIVDDEHTTRTSLLEFVPWTEIGVESVKIAENGKSALTLAESFPPSILLTDVRMPKMNGIALAQRVRELYPECRIVFLSGFSDKEYLKSAIQLNAVDYLEKPIDMPVLKTLFSDLVGKLAEERRKSEEDTKLKKHVEENIHLLRQELTMKLVLQKADLLELQDQYHQEVLQLSPGGAYRVLCVRLNWVVKGETARQSVTKNGLLKRLNEPGRFSDLPFLAGFVHVQDLVVIIGDRMNNDTQSGKTFTDTLFKLLLEHSQGMYAFAAGCSHSSTEYLAIGEMYETAYSVLKQQFYQGSYKVIYSLPAQTTSYEVDKKIYSRYNKVLRSGSLHEAERFVTDLTRDISLTRDPDTNKIKNIYFTLLRILFEVTMKWDLIESEDDSAKSYIWQELEEKTTLSELSGLLLLNIQMALKKSDNKTASTDKMDEIKAYIVKHYADNQLSIQSIAAHVHWSPTYLCACFKKATGKTINEFMTELRVVKAKELLLDRKNKLYEISAFLGFADANYFSTLFKKYTKLTPSEYREKHTHDQ